MYFWMQSYGKIPKPPNIMRKALVVWKKFATFAENYRYGD